jgi:hypothetical protein
MIKGLKYINVRSLSDGAAIELLGCVNKQKSSVAPLREATSGTSTCKINPITTSGMHLSNMIALIIAGFCTRERISPT